jgi:cell division protein FtsI (penicillin-binding protein 3)
MSYTPREYLKFKMPLGRTRAVLAMFGLIGIGVMGRVLYLQTTKSDFLEQQGEARFSRVIEMPYLRGSILDRNGLPLAVSLFAYTVSANPEHAVLTSRETGTLASLLELPTDKVAAKLASPKQLVILKKRVDPDAAETLRSLKLPGIMIRRELHRSYSQDAAFSHIVGFTDINDTGMEGAELAFNSQLVGKSGRQRITKDLKGRVVSEPEDVILPQHGKDLTLSLDARIQNIVFEELIKVQEKYRAKSASAVMIDPKTGEVMAMASVPSFNPSEEIPRDKSLVRNRPVTDLYEPGSTLKPFTMAAALNSGHVGYNTIIDTGNGRITVGRHTITDTHPAGAIPAWDVIAKSSNVGMTKITLGMPAQVVDDVLRGAGFAKKPGIGLPGEAKGLLRPASTWKPIEQATISFGNGVSVSLIQLVRAYTIFARDGTLSPLTLLKADSPAAGQRVISQKAADEIRRMLATVTEKGGTGLPARVPGYTVGGKTGTAHKVVGRTYGHVYVGSFVGMVPATNPRFILGVVVDEPKGAHYGGVVAAPTWAVISGRTLELLKVPKDRPENPDDAKSGPIVVED